MNSFSFSLLTMQTLSLQKCNSKGSEALKHCKKMFFHVSVINACNSMLVTGGMDKSYDKKNFIMSPDSSLTLI